MIYQNSSEFGSGDEAVQACYLEKQEQVFSGGNRNPAKRPAIKDGISSSSEAAMNNFHGIAEYLPARSVLQELPFVTRFGLGNGKTFRNEGKVTFGNKWFNVGVQDYLPTWRWWITDDSNNVPEGRYRMRIHLRRCLVCRFGPTHERSYESIQRSSLQDQLRRF